MLWIFCAFGMRERGYSFGDHPSDLELIVRGRTLKELFAEAGRALVEYTEPPAGTSPLRLRKVQLSGSDREELLVLWLNELIYLLETGFLPSLPLEIDGLTGRSLRTSLKGRRLDPRSPRAGREVKAATYHQLSIRKTDKHWEARVILDL